MKRPLLVLVATAVAVSLTGAASTDIVRTFTDKNVEKFNHLVVDKNTGRVYIGAVNRLYQLTPDLEIVIEEKTGPELDSDECSVLECTAAVNKKLTDNVNKALVIGEFLLIFVLVVRVGWLRLARGPFATNCS